MTPSMIMLMVGTGAKSLGLVQPICFVVHTISLTCGHFIGHLFSSRLKKALVMQVKHGQAFVKFNATFPPAVVGRWEKMVAEWDCDKTKKNPYEEPIAGR
jgi:hypothetical protein